MSTRARNIATKEYPYCKIILKLFEICIYLKLFQIEYNWVAELKRKNKIKLC